MPKDTTPKTPKELNPKSPTDKKRTKRQDGFGNMSASTALKKASRKK